MDTIEQSFLKLVESSKRQRAALMEAMEIIRSFQRGDPDAFANAARASPRLEEVELEAKNQV